MKKNSFDILSKIFILLLFMQSTQLTLSQFVLLVRQWFEQLFGDQHFLIVAQVSKIKERHTIYYLELVEYEWDKVLATSHALIKNPSLLFAPLRERKLNLQDLVWQQILITCSAVFHRDYGHQLHIHHISSEYTMGTIQKKITDITGQLQQLWIFTLNKQKNLTLPPFHIALISSASSEWLNDFLYTMNHSDYQYSYRLFPTAIHGNMANSEIYQTLKIIYSLIDSRSELFDLVLIVRWGGGASGILWHNDLNIAKGICYMPVPVMIAVGHTNDQFLLDQIACFSAKTPTDAAYQLIWYYDTLKQSLDHYHNDNISLCNQHFDWRDREYRLLYSSIIEHISTIKEWYRVSIGLWYDQIMSTRPEKMLQSGYALLHSRSGDLMSKMDIVGIEPQDELIVHIYDRKLLVTVKDIS